MKKGFCFVLMIVFTAVLSGCGCKHKWAEATCLEQKHCVKCGKTEGDPLNHSFSEATCTEPRTCIRCGETMGEALGHSWVERSLEAPKHCTRCGLTEGEKITCTELTFKKIPVQELSGMIFRKDTIIGVDYKAWKLHFYDYDENEFAKVDLMDFTGDDCAWTVTILSPYINDDIYFTFQVIDADDVAHIYIFDGYGKQIGRVEQKVSIPHGHHLDLLDIADGRYVRYADDDSDSSEAIVSIDFETMSVVSSDTGSPLESVLPPGDHYEYFSTCLYNEKYLLAYKENGRVVYYRYEYRIEEAEFADATSFSPYGFAIASLDGENYDLFDKDLNTIAKGIAKGSFAAWRGDSVFYVLDNGVKRFYSIR